MSTTPNPSVPDGYPRRRRAGRPSTSEAQNLEQDILAAALQEFRTNGCAGASIERIAEVAKVTRSAIYRRYIDKQNLFLSVVERQIAILAEQARAVVRPSDDALTALRRTAQAHCHFVLTPLALDLQRIVIWEATSARTGVPPLPTDLSDPLDRLVEAAQAAGQLKPGPAPLWRDALLRLVAEGPRWQALASGQIWTEEMMRDDFERMWPMFLALAGTGDSD